MIALKRKKDKKKSFRSGKIELASFCQSSLGRLNLPLSIAGVIKIPIALIAVKNFIGMVTSCFFLFFLSLQMK